MAFYRCGSGSDEFTVEFSGYAANNDGIAEANHRGYREMLWVSRTALLSASKIECRNTAGTDAAATCYISSQTSSIATASSYVNSNIVTGLTTSYRDYTDSIKNLINGFTGDFVLFIRNQNSSNYAQYAAGFTMRLTFGG